MKLSQWAKKHGYTYRGAYGLFKSGRFPCKTTQLATGTILVEENDPITDTPRQVVIYCRVSSYEKKADLERQAERCAEFCRVNGWQVKQVIKEVASGMNDTRPKLIKCLKEKPTCLLVEHKDRLTRFGFNYFETFLPMQGCELLVINRDSEDESDLMKDLVAVITSFCCRLYGLRRSTRKVTAIKEVLARESDG